MQLFEKALSVALNAGNKKVQLQSKIQLGLLCMQFQQNTSALEMFIQARELAEGIICAWLLSIHSQAETELGDFNTIASIRLHAGIACRRSGDVIRAAEEFAAASHVAQSLCRKSVQSHAAHNLALCAMQSDELELAVRVWKYTTYT